MTHESVILIDEKVLPAQNPTDLADAADMTYSAALSLAMKTMFNASERRSGAWRELIAQVGGLEIRDVRQFTPFKDAVIVIGLKD